MTDLEYVSVDQTTGEIYNQVNPRQDDLDTQWHQLVERGQEIVANREDSYWSIGDLACEVATRWKRNGKTLIKFASEINMAHPERIYEYHEVSEFFDREDSARCELLASCPTLNWSKFREAYRGCKRRGWKAVRGEQHLKACSDNEMSTKTFSEYFRKLPNDDGTPVQTTFTERKRIPCAIVEHYIKEDEPIAKLVIEMPKNDALNALSLMKATGFISYLNLRYEVEKVK